MDNLIAFLLSLTSLFTPKPQVVPNRVIFPPAQVVTNITLPTATPSALLKVTMKPKAAAVATVAYQQPTQKKSPVSISPLPKNTYKKGEYVSLDVSVAEPNDVTKVVIGVASGLTSKDYGYEGATLTQPPFKFNIRVPETTYISSDNKVYLTAYAYKKDGSYMTDTVTVQVVNSDVAINILKPTDNQNFNVNDTVEIEVDTIGDVSKVEFYIGSGALLQTFTSKPFTYKLSLSPAFKGITGKQNTPLGVKAYKPNGEYVYKSVNLQVNP